MPIAKIENGTWPHPSRLPLGGGWSGHCTAPGHEGNVPSDDILHAFCNLGYASTCEWSPKQRTSDAVRFAVSAPASGKDASSAARVIRLNYVCERDHRPCTHGELAYDLSAGVWLQCHEDPRIQKMADCFLQAYLKKKA